MPSLFTPQQKIAITEKYRPIYEKQAKEKQSDAGKNYGNGTEKLPPKLGEAKKSKENETNTKLSKLAGVGKEEKPSQNSSKAINKIDVRAKLAETAGVSTDTYSKGAKILNSGE